MGYRLNGPDVQANSSFAKEYAHAEIVDRGDVRVGNRHYGDSGDSGGGQARCGEVPGGNHDGARREHRSGRHRPSGQDRQGSHGQVPRRGRFEREARQGRLFIHFDNENRRQQEHDGHRQGRQDRHQGSPHRDEAQCQQRAAAHRRQADRHCDLRPGTGARPTAEVIRAAPAPSSARKEQRCS